MKGEKAKIIVLELYMVTFIACGLRTKAEHVGEMCVVQEKVDTHGKSKEFEKKTVLPLEQISKESLLLRHQQNTLTIINHRRLTDN